MAGSGTQQGFDLHTHSVFSDGTTRPSDIAREAGVDFLPGIEITTKHAGRSRHLLGYGIDPAAGELFAALAEVRSSRLGRAQEMVRRLSAAYAITWESVVGEEDARTVGRPHIADALVAAGYFADRSTAFAEILHPGSPYYLGTYAIETVEAIRLVRAAGGAAALAHPAAFRQRTPTTARELRELAAAGLWGVELDHPENRADWLPPLAEAAAELGLAVTGSSDYHGVGKPNLLGERATDPALVERLRERLVTPR
jgi:predicted metal-dependent phosphoesterase TrpH